MDPSSLGVASAGSGVELGLADPASLAWEDNLVDTAINLSTPDIRCSFRIFQGKKKAKILKVCLGRPATSGYLLLATGSKPGLARWEVARGCRHWLYD